MSVSTSSPLNSVTTVAVAPTETVILSVGRDNLRGAKRITVGVENEDASQTFLGVVYRRMSGMTVWAQAPIENFSSIGPASSVVVDLDVEGTDELEVRGYASGAGLNVRVKANRKASTP